MHVSKEDRRLYCIADGDAVKIGVSANVDERMIYLQMHNPRQLTLLGTKPGGMRDERLLHARFDHLRIHGEWFRAAPELTQEVSTWTT